MRRTETTWGELVDRLPELAVVPAAVAQQVVHDAKYAGYVDRQQTEVERQQRLAARRIPAEFDYAAVPQLRAEAREQLDRIRPVDVAQAARIRGITPADVAILLVSLERHDRRGGAA